MDAPSLLGLPAGFAGGGVGGRGGAAGSLANAAPTSVTHRLLTRPSGAAQTSTAAAATSTSALYQREGIFLATSCEEDAALHRKPHAVCVGWTRVTTKTIS
jgi:hypothetical protein